MLDIIFCNPPSSTFILSSPLSSTHISLLYLSLQASRDEGYEVDEALAEQDAASLFEVRCQIRPVLCELLKQKGHVTAARSQDFIEIPSAENIAILLSNSCCANMNVLLCKH